MSCSPLKYQSNSGPTSSLESAMYPSTDTTACMITWPICRSSASSVLSVSAQVAHCWPESGPRTGRVAAQPDGSALLVVVDVLVVVIHRNALDGAEPGTQIGLAVADDDRDARRGG